MNWPFAVSIIWPSRNSVDGGVGDTDASVAAQPAVIHSRPMSSPCPIIKCALWDSRSSRRFCSFSGIGRKATVLDPSVYGRYAAPRVMTSHAVLLIASPYFHALSRAVAGSISLANYQALTRTRYAMGALAPSDRSCQVLGYGTQSGRTCPAHRSAHACAGCAGYSLERGPGRKDPGLVGTPSQRADRPPAEQGPPGIVRLVWFS